jgi:hypothetical protein
MNELPKYIADLCGVVDQDEIVLGVGRPYLPSPIQMIKDHTGVWTVTYGPEEIGWVNQIGSKMRQDSKYRAVSVHGAVKHCGSLDAARSFIMAEYY